MFRCRLFALFNFGMYPLFRKDFNGKRATVCRLDGVACLFESLSPGKVKITISKCSSEDLGTNREGRFNHLGDTVEQKKFHCFVKGDKLPHVIESIWEKKNKKKEEHKQLTIPYFNGSHLNFDIKSCRGICRYHDVIIIQSEENFEFIRGDGLNEFALQSFVVSESKYKFQEDESSILVSFYLIGGQIERRVIRETYDCISQISKLPFTDIPPLMGSQKSILNFRKSEVKFRSESFNPKKKKKDNLFYQFMKVING